MKNRIPAPLAPPWLRWLAVAVVALVIFVLSIVYAPPPSAVAPKPEFSPLDKWRHFLVYATLATTLWYAS